MVYDLGVDVGTSYTAAAVRRPDGSIEVVGLGPIADNIPSVLYLNDDSTVIVGDAAARRAAIDPAGAAREFKRRMGDQTPMILRTSPFSAESLIGKMLEYVVQRVADRERALPRNTVVTHPANWGPYKLDLLDHAIRMANIDPASRLTEPHAAALAYTAEARVPVGATVAVYDLGGGTFDAAVLRKTDDAFELLGESVGIEHLGGVDFDEAILHHVRTTVGPRWPSDPDDPSLPAPMLHLRRACMEAKELLSSEHEVAIPVLLPGVDTTVTLTRRQFETMIAPRLDDSVNALEAAIMSAGLTASDLSGVLLVGGSSRIPLVGELLRQRFGRLVAADVDPLYAVARGAALAAGARGNRNAPPVPAPPADTSFPTGRLAAAPPAAAPPAAAPPAAAPPAAAPPVAAPPAAAPPAAAPPVVAPAPLPVAAPAAPVAPPPAATAPVAGPVPPAAAPASPNAPAAPFGAAGPSTPPTGPPPGATPPAGPGPGFVAGSSGGPPSGPGRSGRRRIKILVPVVVLALVAVAAGVGYAVTRGEGTTVDTGDTAAASAAAASGASDTPGTTTTVAGGASTATAKKASAVDMAQIPAGTFTLGAKKPEANSAETLETKADVAAFAIDLFEVSNEQWKAFVDRKEAAAPLAWRGGRFPADRPKRPVEGVTFDWASAYCTSLGKRLPTETEWEVAARGPNAAIYPWGDTATTVALPDPDSYDVGTIAGNKSAFGVFDLAGNVWEWVDKPYDKRITAAQRVLRGGQHGYLRKNVTRLAVDPATSNAITVAGFRCAADAAAVDAAVPALAFGDFTKPQAPTPPQKAQPAPNVLLFDDFRDATSGWVERSTETARYGYHPNEYFHLETKAEKQDVLALSPAAVDPAKPISVKTKAFVDPDLTAAGGAFDYGLAFRMDKDGKGLVFVVSSRTSEWKICTRSGDMSYVLLESKGRTIPDTVEIEVRMSGDIYEFHIGGQLVTSKSIPGFTGTGAGMVLISYPGSTKAHVHYDEFQLATL